MVKDPLLHPSISVQNALDVDQSNGEFKILPEDLHDLKCNNKYEDPLPVEMNNGFFNMESPGQDCCADVKETQRDAGVDDFVEPSATCPSKTKDDEDNEVLSSVGLSVMELEPSISQQCVRETDSGAVKDICIDEGVLLKDTVLIAEIVKDLKLNHMLQGIYFTKHKEFDSEREKVDAEWPAIRKSLADGGNEKNLNSTESKSESAGLVLSDLLKEKVVDTLNTCADESLIESSVETERKEKQDAGHKEFVTEGKVVGSKLICSNSFPDSSVKETADYSKVEISDTEPTAALEMTNKSSFPTEGDNSLAELLSSANHPQQRDPVKLVSDNYTPSAPLQREDHFESSFTSAGHYAGSITYSGQIVRSGSLSHRSDASTASTRSFAFPVLQNEWNFSPVRMQKADRRHLRRHRRMHGLFCCKF